MFVQDKLDHKKTKYLKHMALVITELKLQVWAFLLGSVTA